jgi:hypothetical protein
MNWGWPDQRRWIGPLSPWIGVVTNEDGSVRSGWGVGRPLWSAQRLRAEWALEVHPHHIKLPLLWLWIPLAIPPAAVMVVRRLLYRAPYECRRCRYDLRGTAGPCPECGADPPVPAHTPA